ncbi:hypothetical protein [Helicobacter felis]|uniref:hypothetical protein n=1 Tax=Helicobacter felis TaxID=214 RepID=UPI002D77120C|nr:hypothetical protein [Helicobacter felis]
MFQWGGKTPEQSCSATIYEALKIPDKLPFIKVQDKPKVLIALKDSSLLTPKPAPKEQPPKEPVCKERDLHPRLSYIAYHQWGLYTKTIYHEESKKSKKGMDKWIYPDMVGVSFAYKDFESPNVRSFIKKFDTLPIKLVSFELIGVIVLDIERIEQSATLLNAREKENLDYQTIAKLAERNQTFEKLLKRVADFELEDPKNFFDPILKDLPPLN